jgi:hypothetical protein
MLAAWCSRGIAIPLSKLFHHPTIEGQIQKILPPNFCAVGIRRHLAKDLDCDENSGGRCKKPKRPRVRDANFALATLFRFVTVDRPVPVADASVVRGFSTALNLARKPMRHFSPMEKTLHLKPHAAWPSKTKS